MRATEDVVCRWCGGRKFHEIGEVTISDLERPFHSVKMGEDGMIVALEGSSVSDFCELNDGYTGFAVGCSNPSCDATGRHIAEIAARGVEWSVGDYVFFQGRREEIVALGEGELSQMALVLGEWVQLHALEAWVPHPDQLSWVDGWVEAA